MAINTRCAYYTRFQSMFKIIMSIIREQKSEGIDFFKNIIVRRQLDAHFIEISIIIIRF